MSKSDKERNRIKDEFEQIQSESNDFDISNHLATPDDLPDLGVIEIYDYESDLSTSSKQSMDVLESLVDLYLGDVPKLKDHPYIANKMKEDAMVYSEAIFLARMTRKNFLSQLRQVDNGDNSARMHEVVNQTIGQIRENAKFLSGQRTELEKFYKTLRKDLGYEEIDNPDVKVDEPIPTDHSISNSDGLITNNRNLNDLIKNAMLNKEDKKKKN
jgi:hypothetical protein